MPGRGVGAGLSAGIGAPHSPNKQGFWAFYCEGLTAGRGVGTGLLAGIGAYIVLNLGLFILKGLHEYFVYEKQLPEPSLKHAFLEARRKWVDHMNTLPQGGPVH